MINFKTLYCSLSTALKWQQCHQYLNSISLIFFKMQLLKSDGSRSLYKNKYIPDIITIEETLKIYACKGSAVEKNNNHNHILFLKPPDFWDSLKCLMLVTGNASKKINGRLGKIWQGDFLGIVSINYHF